MRDRYVNTPAEDLARDLSRTVNQVRKKAQQLGLQTWRMWSEADRETIRAKWGKVPTRQIARELGRTTGAVKQQALKLGLDAGRRYTDAEKDLVSELYPTHSAAQIAERIHGAPRAAKSIFRLAKVLGLRKWPSWEPEVIARVKELYAEGLSDFQIRERMPGVFAPGDKGRDQVKHIRKDRLKLPAIPDPTRGARASRSQLKTLGLKCPADLRTRAYKLYAVENGWPEDFLPREVQILNVLAARGPMTALQIAEAVGMRTDIRNSKMGYPKLLGSCNRKKPNGSAYGTYTASLKARGLVCYLRRSRAVKGRRGYPDWLPGLYMLTQQAIDIIERRTNGTDSQAG